MLLTAYCATRRSPCGSRLGTRDRISPGEGDVIATRAGRPVVRYSDAQPTTDTEGEIGSMALYAGTSVDSLRGGISAAEIVRGIAADISSQRVSPLPNPEN